LVEVTEVADLCHGRVEIRSEADPGWELPSAAESEDGGVALSGKVPAERSIRGGVLDHQ
jgi:hypothetical protein